MVAKFLFKCSTCSVCDFGCTSCRWSKQVLCEGHSGVGEPSNFSILGSARVQKFNHNHTTIHFICLVKSLHGQIIIRSEFRKKHFTFQHQFCQEPGPLPFGHPSHCIGFSSLFLCTSICTETFEIKN